MSKEARSYEYFNTPDGDDIGKKLVCVLKPCSLFAFAVSTADILLHSKPKGYLSTLGRYAYIGLPLLGMATTFVAVTNLAANIRGKDDKFNWFLGGMATGAILGAWRNSQTLGWVSGMVFGGVACGKKYSVQNNIILIPNSTQRSGGIGNVRHDYTITRNPPPNWSKF